MSQNTIPSSYQLVGISSVIGAALDTGLLLEIASKPPAMQAELATRLGLAPRALALVIDVLKTVELVHSDAEGRVLPGEALVAAMRTPGGVSLAFGMWSHTEAFLRTGEPFIVMDQAPGQREQAYTNVVAGLGAWFEPHARDLAGRLPVQPKQILDVGCGSGVWGLAFGERHRAAHVTGQDLPAVLANFTARAATLSLSERTSTLPGDMHSVELPSNKFDLAIIANVLRIDTPTDAEQLVGHVGKSVAPGGSLLVIDALASGTPERERSRSLYAMHLGLRTRAGSVHHPDTITRWLAHAGFSRIEPIDVANGEGGMGGLLATK